MTTEPETNLNLDAERERLKNVVAMRPSSVAPTDDVAPDSPTDDVAPDSSWRPIPLSSDLPPTEPPTLLRVPGRSPLLYQGRTNAIIGESSSGKTWLAVLACLEVLEAGGRVLWLDYETNAREFVERVNALRTYDVPDEWWSRVAYLNPSHRLESRDHGSVTGHALRFAQLVETGFDLAVIDSVTGAMSAEGLDTNSDADVETMFRLIANPLARSGTSVLMLDHVVKNRENRGNDARGSGRKREALSGVMLTMRVTSPWRRAVHESVSGAFTLTVTKDRPGHVGAIGDTVTTGVVTSDPDGALGIRLTTSDAVVQPDARLLEAIVEHLRTYEGATHTQLEKAVGGNAGTFRNALSWLIRSGAVTVDHVGNAHRHHLVKDQLVRLGL